MFAQLPTPSILYMCAAAIPGSAPSPHRPPPFRSLQQQDLAPAADGRRTPRMVFTKSDGSEDAGAKAAAENSSRYSWSVRASTLYAHVTYACTAAAAYEAAATAAPAAATAHCSAAAAAGAEEPAAGAAEADAGAAQANSSISTPDAPAAAHYAAATGAHTSGAAADAAATGGRC